jgi:hypothetical protein
VFSIRSRRIALDLTTRRLLRRHAWPFAVTFESVTGRYRAPITPSGANCAMRPGGAPRLAALHVRIKGCTF